MRIKRRARGVSGETSASSDVAFLLIIYFLVIAGFNVNQGFLMNLPAKNTTRLILRDDLMRFEMDRGGAVFYRGAELSMAGAEREIREAASGRPNLAVVLSIDPEAPWQSVVTFVELAQKLRVEAFSFSMREGA
jgi:biopolymer transport protein ExbD